MAPFVTTSQVILGCVRNVVFPNTLQHLHGPCIVGVAEKSGCEVAFETVRITDFDFDRRRGHIRRDNQVFVKELELLSVEAEPLRYGVPWIKTKVWRSLTS